LLPHGASGGWPPITLVPASDRSRPHTIRPPYLPQVCRVSQELVLVVAVLCNLLLALGAVFLVLQTRAGTPQAAGSLASDRPDLRASGPAPASVDASPCQSRRDGETADPPAPVETPRVDSLVDPATNLPSPRAWELVFEQEENRFLRYGRPTTVVVIELDGLDSFMAVLGQIAADRLIPPVATTLRLNARTADVLARLGYSRFVALLPETGQIAAIQYVDRVRTLCDTWLESGEVSIRLAVGWAEAVSGGTVKDALRLADQRMNLDRHRSRTAGENISLQAHSAEAH